jgi:hypothetical protein
MASLRMSERYVHVDSKWKGQAMTQFEEYRAAAYEEQLNPDKVPLKTVRSSNQ